MGTNWGSLEYTGTCGHANFKVTKNLYRSKMNSNYISWTHLEQFWGKVKCDNDTAVSYSILGYTVLGTDA